MKRKTRSSPGLTDPASSMRSADGSLRRNDDFFDLSLDAMCIVGKNDRFEQVNRAFLEILGYSSDELIGKSFFELVHVDDRDAAHSAVDELRDGETAIRLPSRYRRQDGSYCRLEWMATKQRDGSICALARDTTEIRERETALEMVRQRYRNLFEHAPDCIVVFDLETARFTEANPAAEEMFKMAREELLQVGPVEVSPPHQPDGRPSAERAQKLIEQALSGYSPHFEWTHRDAEGRDFLCEIRVMRMPPLERKLVRASIIDITERRLLAEELNQSRKMEAIGKLAGGIAHDFNNLLTVITGYSETTLLELPDDSPLAPHIDQIRHAALRAASLTSQLLAFSRRQVVQPRVLQLNETVSALAGMLRRLIGENIELVTELDGSLAHVEVDQGQMDQVVINLAVNARDAMPDGGQLIVSTRNASAGPSGQSGAFSVIELRDQGGGIPDKIRERIFEPFFTTKQKGTGLGLSTVYGIVRQNGGHIAVRSETGVGTSFEVYLPATAKRSRAQDPGESTQVGGSETVLLAEDDEVVRALAAEILRRKGYNVLEASNGADALQIAEFQESAIDLVVTDVVMPGISGPEMAERLKVRRPNIDVIFVSGYTDERLPSSALNSAVRFLQKPFTPSELSSIVREVLDREER